MGKSSYFLVDSMAEEAGELAESYENGENGQAQAVMEVVNRAADVKYVYYPYFTRFDDYEIYTDSQQESLFIGSGIGKEQRFTFYPNIGYSAELKDFVVSEVASAVPDGRRLSWYTSEVPMYAEPLYALDVPTRNQASVDRFIEAAGISAEDSDVVDQVVSHLKEDYTYSYNPGRLPAGSDAINYFLDKNKKGVCYHFASAAVLILRRLGIPARYVEGYAFGYSEVLDGKMREDLNYDDYYSGYSELGRTAVMEVEVKNADAHAWVEIYVKGKGWIIVDPTPAVTEDEDTGRSFWSSLTNFLENSPDVHIEGDISGINLSFLQSNTLRFVVSLLLALSVLAFFAVLSIRRFMRWRSWHTQDLSRNLLWYYREVCRRRSRKDVAFGRLTVPSEQMAYLFDAEREKQRGKHRGRKQKSREAESVDEERVIRCLEKICFCPAEPAREDYEYVLGVLRRF